MLQCRCPNLEELVIGSTTSWACMSPFDGLPLIGTIWPKLRTLNLRHVEFNAFPEVAEDRAQVDEKVISFLASLPSLQQVVGMSRHFSSPTNNLNFSCSSSLPLTSISTFYLDSVLVHHLTLQELDLLLVGLIPPIPSSWQFSNVPSGSFQALVTLTMRFSVRAIDNSEEPRPPHMGDHADTVQAALRICPRLLHLRIVCQNDSSSTFYWVGTHSLN